MAHALEPIDDSFFDRAPIVVRSEVALDAPPQQVWDALGSDRMWSWFGGIDRLQWLSPRPLRGTPIRRLRLAGLATIEEEFYRWDEPHRATFRVTQTTRPLLRGLAEDFVLEERGGGTSLTWIMAVAPKPFVPRGLGAVLSRAMTPANTKALAGIREIL